jgi:hypothetical protein
MMGPCTREVTQLLRAWSEGEQRERRMPRGIREGRRLTDQTLILDREWLARCRAIRWTEITDGVARRLLWRTQRGGDGGGAQSIARHRDARLEYRQGLALPRTGWQDHRWTLINGKQVDNLMQAVLERPPEERDTFLRHAWIGSEALEREVRSLLTSQPTSGSFLERPAIEVAARALAR